MSKFTWVVIFFCLLSCESHDTRFPFEKKFKVEYHVGDILTYKSNSGEEFFLKVLDIQTTESTVSKDANGGPYYIYERERVMYDSLDSKIANKTLEDNIWSELPGGYVHWPIGLDACITNNCIFSYHDTLQINGVAYDAVFRLQPSTNRGGEVITWYYTYKRGFVGFELRGNRVFNLVSTFHYGPTHAAPSLAQGETLQMK